jgi:hypothetical protein
VKTQSVTITCDFCGYDSTWSGPELFVVRGDAVDLCRWCATEPPPLRTMSSGRHEITFAEDWSWTCSCGEASTDWESLHLRVTRSPRVVAAVPNLGYALARIHSEKR